MADVIDDVMWESRENDTNLNEGTLNTGGSGVDDDFEELLEAVETKLYPGCTFSFLDFLAKLMHMKVNNKWTDSSFDQLLELLYSAFPPDNKVPHSYYLAKKKLKKLGLGYESIHVCKNECFLFQKEHKSLQVCPVCKESRWIDKNTRGKKVAHKVLRTGRSEDGVMRHPVDGECWQQFDVDYPDFSSEPRNVRVGLAADGFNLFGNMCNLHSTWPVVLTTYNLPPWLCMKESSFMLALLIPGPKAPGKDIDVFLRPLVEEFKFLWQSGIRIKDAARNTFFTMKAMLLWTINDFPSRSSLSGLSGQGYRACPTYNEDTPSYRAVNKVVYIGHRRFLDVDDPLRTSLKFNGQPETRPTPRHFTNEDIQEQLGHLILHKPGESLLGTSMMNDKSKDTSNTCKDLKNLNIRRNQWLQKRGNKFTRPHASYSFKKPDRKIFCQFIRDVKFPDGFGSNISKKVVDNDTNIIGLKSYDYHILMQRLVPIGVRALLDKETSILIVDLCMFFKQICSRTLKVEDMRKAKEDIIRILCKLELIYPPAFFDIMIHLVLHLPDEAIAGGPVCMRWMYPFERYMKKLKNYVINKGRPEGCIAEGYIAEEALTFCTMYLRDVNRLERNEDVVIEKTKFWMFESKCRPTSATQIKHLDIREKCNIEWFILNSCQEVRQYIE
ncbi:uncharacterized protein LOC128132784 [Lactuca sativa]|uniref:uncharacterized protein LOC128132784 n=1 Tax=Lactuca sativa TaxID=4236 RepID=UPI0022B07DD6|nr:uncharacterized protein LOC128132784 [Lactuca sativa]